MIDMLTVCKAMEDDINSVTQFSLQLYDKYFGSYFRSQKELYQRFQDKTRPITDDELEKILTELPLELIEVSEALAQFQISQEVVKLKTKELSKDKNSDSYLESKLMVEIYTAVTERVGREISYSRELIMSSKKIWDRRKDTDVVNPIDPIDTSLPEYIPPTTPNTYVK